MSQTTVKTEAASALKNLADLLEVDLHDPRLAIATVSESAKVRMYDGSLEAEVVPTSRGTVYIEAPRAPGIVVELVDHQQDSHAPAGAVYEIKAYMPNGQNKNLLNGHVFSVYVGREGILLDDAGLMTASEIFSKNKR